MPAVTRLWRLLPHNRVAIDHLSKQLSVSPIIAQLLLNREIHSTPDAKRFLEANLSGMHPPTLLPGVEQAVELIFAAIERRDKICIYGDYDVDGTTGTAILVGLLQRLHTPVEFYVPHRLEEGYGLNSEALKTLAERGVKLVVTVDCGIASLAEADVAKQLGITLIVTDHHEMKPTLPKAAVCVHPRLPGTKYPFGGLSGAGVAFKLAWALAVRHCGSEKVTPVLRDYLMDALCLATLGLVADVVPLHDENRILVKHGLNRLNQKPPLGIKALLDSAKSSGDKPIKADDIGYRLGPRINAAGRLGYAGLVVEMFTTVSPEKAREVADYLDTQNSQRQTIERKMTAQAKELADSYMADDPCGLVLAHAEWHPGVVGIVASRIVEYTGCPAVLFAMVPDQEVVTGSGRSIHGFELHEALNACDDVLVGHGGHAMAAGAKIRPLMIPVFRERFAQYAAEHFPQGTPPAPQIRIDAEIPLSSLTLGLVNDLSKLEPYGAENPKPIFLAGDLQIVGEPKKMGAGERHLGLRVKQGTTTMRAVAFGMADRVDELMSDSGRCSLVFTPNINEWNGYRNVELTVEDFQAGPTAKLD